MADFPALAVNPDPVNIGPAVSEVNQLRTGSALREYYGAQSVEAQERANQLRIGNQFSQAFNSYRLNALSNAGGGGAAPGAPGGGGGGGDPSAGGGGGGAAPNQGGASGDPNNPFHLPPGYMDAMAIGDPAGLNQLQQAQRSRQEQQQAGTTFSQNQQVRNWQAYAAMPDDKSRGDFFHARAEEAFKSGAIGPAEYAAEASMTPGQRDQFVARKLAANMTPEQFQDFTGLKAGAAANAELPANAVKALLENAGRITALTGTQRPVTGAQVMGVGSPSDLLRNLNVPSPTLVPPVRPQPGAAPANAGGNAAPPPGLLDALNNPGGAARASPDAAPPAQPSTVKIADGREIAIPKVPLPQTPLRDPSGNVQGPSLSLIDAQQKASDEYHEDLKEADDANKTMPGLKTLDAALKSGQFQTNATAPARAMVAGYVMALTDDAGLAKTLTGVQPEMAAVSDKEMYRIGTTYARVTGGARQAVQGLKIELGANPQMSTVLNANKAIVGMMMRDTQYKIDTGRAANAYLFANGHSLGFGPWWQSPEGAPASDYTMGKVMPYDAPRNPDGTLDKGMLMPGFYYNTKSGPKPYSGTGFPQ